MIRTALAVAVLSVAGFAFSQQQPGASPGKQGGQPATTQQPSATPQAPAAGTPGKRPPQAKSQPEYDAFNAAKTNAKDAASWNKAADDFAAKFPESELRILLYEQTLTTAQQANDSDRISDVGRKILTMDPDQPDALLAVAEVLVERTHDTDIDKDQRYDEAAKYAQHALETVDTGISIPAGTPQDKVDAYKAYLKSSAYSLLGTVQFNKEKFKDAESNYRKSLEAFPSQPDPIVVLRLALALDKQEKYPDALVQANKAVELTQENTTAGTYARRERDRLVQLTGGGAAVSKPGAPK